MENERFNCVLFVFLFDILVYDKADFVAIMKSIEMFKWREHLDNIACPNEQVELLNEVLLNIYSNFIPNSSNDQASPGPMDNANCQKFSKEQESCL